MGSQTLRWMSQRVRKYPQAGSGGRVPKYSAEVQWFGGGIQPRRSGAGVRGFKLVPFQAAFYSLLIGLRGLNERAPYPVPGTQNSGPGPTIFASPPNV